MYSFSTLKELDYYDNPFHINYSDDSDNDYDDDVSESEVSDSESVDTNDSDAKVEDDVDSGENVDSIVSAVIQKFKTRSALGLEKYGVTLDRHDLTVIEWIQHAQDENMDAILYLEKLKQLELAKIKVAKNIKNVHDEIVLFTVQLISASFVLVLMNIVTNIYDNITI